MGKERKWIRWDKRKSQTEREWEFLTEGGSGCSILPQELTATQTIRLSVNEMTVRCQSEEGGTHHVAVFMDDWKTLLSHAFINHGTGLDLVLSLN